MLIIEYVIDIFNVQFIYCINESIFYVADFKSKENLLPECQHCTSIINWWLLKLSLAIHDLNYAFWSSLHGVYNYSTPNVYRLICPHL